jgi:ketosteroid isomerase-like protein
MSKRLALTLLLFLGEIAHAQTLATAARQPDQPIGSNQPAAQQLSLQQNEVWKGEQNYFRYLQAKDLKGFMSIGDDNFLGWPDYSEMPLRKQDIESGAAAEFQNAKQTARLLPVPKPEAIGMFGDVAVTHYFWPGVDEISPVKYRITYTWQRGSEGWHIISRMDCAVPRSAEAAPETTRSGQSSASHTVPSTIAAKPDLQSTPTQQRDAAKILEIDRAWGQAYVKGEIDVIDRTLAPDWRGWLDTSGSDKAMELAEFTAGKNRSLENIIDNARVRVYGNTAVVEARERVRLRDETGEHWVTWHITDVFVKQDNQWQVVASHGSTIPNP